MPKKLQEMKAEGKIMKDETKATLALASGGSAPSRWVS
jgi:hypothetical protein